MRSSQVVPIVVIPSYLLHMVIYLRNRVPIRSLPRCLKYGWSWLGPKPGAGNSVWVSHGWREASHLNPNLLSPSCVRRELELWAWAEPKPTRSDMGRCPHKGARPPRVLPNPSVSDFLSPGVLFVICELNRGEKWNPFSREFQCDNVVIFLQFHIWPRPQGCYIPNVFEVFLLCKVERRKDTAVWSSSLSLLVKNPWWCRWFLGFLLSMCLSVWLAPLRWGDTRQSPGSFSALPTPCTLEHL